MATLPCRITAALLLALACTAGGCKDSGQSKSLSADHSLRSAAKPAAAPSRQTAAGGSAEQNRKEPSVSSNSRPRVKLNTSLGDIVIELDRGKAPITVANFLRYANEGFYDGTIFHRVIPNFMIQGGGFTSDMVQKKTHEQIKNEAENGLLNKRGTVAMARTNAVDSATSQFFINVKDNSFLDHGVRDFGYCVFGKVVEGMDVVAKIEGVATGNVRGMGDVPLEPVVITHAEVLAAQN